MGFFFNDLRPRLVRHSGWHALGIGEMQGTEAVATTSTPKKLAGRFVFILVIEGNCGTTTLWSGGKDLLFRYTLFRNTVTSVTLLYVYI